MCREFVEASVSFKFRFLFNDERWSHIKFQVTGAGVDGPDVPRLCGELSGQHIIYTPMRNKIAKLSIATDSNNPDDR